MAANNNAISKLSIKFDNHFRYICNENIQFKNTIRPQIRAKVTDLVGVSILPYEITDKINKTAYRGMITIASTPAANE